MKLTKVNLNCACIECGYRGQYQITYKNGEHFLCRKHFAEICLAMSDQVRRENDQADWKKTGDNFARKIEDYDWYK